MNNKDWVGNKNSVFKILGANNHCDHEYAEHSFYATDPNALLLLLLLEQLEKDNIKLHDRIWECACGEGHLSKVLKEKGYKVVSSDLIDRRVWKFRCKFFKTKYNFLGRYFN